MFISNAQNVKTKAIITDPDLILETRWSENLTGIYSLKKVGIGTSVHNEQLNLEGNLRLANAGSYIQKVKGMYFTWSSDYGTQDYHGIFSTNGTTYSDGITINSYGNVRINFDSNSNGTNNFSVGANTNNLANTYFTVLDGGNVGIGTSSPAYKLHTLGDIYIEGGWLKVSGSNGILFQSFGGGFYMTDATWIRTYGNKNFYHNSGIMRTDGIFQVGSNGNRFIVNSSGNVGIGTISPTYKLSVKGTIGCGEIKVEDVNLWADFVFEPEYNLMSLNELEIFIKTNKHLPEIPTATDVKENGIAVGEMNAKLLQKIEELTLYIIQLEKRVSELEDK